MVRSFNFDFPFPRASFSMVILVWVLKMNEVVAVVAHLLVTRYGVATLHFYRHVAAFFYGAN